MGKKQIRERNGNHAHGIKLREKETKKIRERREKLGKKQIRERNWEHVREIGLEGKSRRSEHNRLRFIY